MSDRQLRKLAAQGKLRPSDLLRVDGDSGWTTVANIEGLLVRPSSEGASKPPAPNSGASPAQSEKADSEPADVPTFGEWYGRRWPSKLMWIFQIPIWLFYGFVWIPVWYVLTAVPSGNPIRRWLAVPASGKVVSLLPLLLIPLLINSRVQRSAQPTGSSVSQPQPSDGLSNAKLADEVSVTIGELAGDWRDESGETHRLVLSKTRRTSLGGHEREYTINEANSNDSATLILSESSLGKGKGAETEVSRGAFHYRKHHHANGEFESGEYTLSSRGVLTLVGQNRVETSRGEQPFAQEWIRTNRLPNANALSEPVNQSSAESLFPTFGNAAGAWKCRKTDAELSFEPLISTDENGRVGIRKSVLVSHATTPFTVRKGNEVWIFEFHENGYVYGHPRKNIKSHRGRIGTFEYDGKILSVRLALTASRSDLGTIPWEFEYELVRP